MARDFAMTNQLRIGHLYRPGTIYAPDGSFVRQVRAGTVPIVGGGTARSRSPMPATPPVPWWPRRTRTSSGR
jgi:hypothetical protein